jgi:seryl-tRNA synthetase
VWRFASTDSTRNPYPAEGGLENPHTLNGTMVTDRALLAILENFQGGVPDVLRSFGAPAQITA